MVPIAEDKSARSERRDVPRILVLGAGFAGIGFCRAFPRGVARITIVDRANYHLFQPLLYQVATTGLSAADIAQPIRTIVRDRDDIDVIMAEVHAVDLNERRVKTSAGEIGYDYLLVALGGRTSYFGSPHWRVHAPGLKTVEDALEIRRRLLTAFEEAEWTRDEDLQNELATVVIVGGGPTGVELAGSIAELTRRVMAPEFRRFDSKRVRVILVEGGRRLLAGYSEESSAAARRQLEALGVDVQTGVLVSGIRASEVVLGDRTIRARTILWTAGVAAVETTANLGVPLDRLGRILVHPDLSLPGHPEAFAAGDVVYLTDSNGTAVPGVAPAAKQMGVHIAEVLARELRDAGSSRPRPAFLYREKGRMATVGRSAAVAEFQRMKFSGFSAWLAWLGVHLVFLMGMRNRLSVFASWVYSYVVGRRRARIIVDLPSSGDVAENQPADARPPAEASTGR